MFSIERLSDNTVALYRDNVQVVVLPEKSEITVEFVVNDVYRKKSFTTLETFIKGIEKSDNFDLLDINIILEDDSKHKILFVESFPDASQKTLKVSFPYQKEMHVYEQGLSSYHYVKRFLPIWSTAFKNRISSHTKAFEPLFTWNKNIEYAVKNIIEESPIQNIEDVLSYERDKERIFKASEKHLDGFLSNFQVPLNTDLNKVVDNRFSVFYMRTSAPQRVVVEVKGIVEGVFIKETVELDQGKVYRLKYNYSKINTIVNLSLNVNDPEVFLSNILPIEDYINLDPERKSYKKDNVIYKESEGYENNFIDTLPFNNGVVCDENDNILSVFNDKLYSAKLNTNLSLDIPEDVSYNNSRYISYQSIEGTVYEVYMDLLDFCKDTNSSRIYIKIVDDKSNEFYVNEHYSIVNEKTYIDVRHTSNDKVLDIELDNETEYAIINLESESGRFKKSCLILQPSIQYIPLMYILPTERLFYANDEYYLVDTNKKHYTPLKLAERKESLKVGIDYVYYYLSSDIYPIFIADEDKVKVSVTNFSIHTSRIRKEFNLNDSDSADTFSSFESNLLSVDSKEVIKYSTKTLGLDTVASSDPYKTFSLENTPMIIYTNISDAIPVDSFSSTPIKSFKMGLTDFHIIDYGLQERTQISVKDFLIKVEEAV